VLGPAVVIDLGAGAARTGHAHRPEVVLLATALDAVGGKADLPPQPHGVVVVEIDGGPHALGVEPEALGDQLVGERDRLSLEVVAEGEVAEHLEKREVPGGVADVLDVGGAEALLDAGGAAEVGHDLAQEVRLELVHARVGEQQRRVVGDQRAGGHQAVSSLDEEVEEPASDLVGVHVHEPRVDSRTCRAPAEPGQSG